MKQYIVNSRFVPLGLGLALAGMAHAGFDPIPLTSESYSADVIIENTATPVLQLVTTASVDQGTNNGAATWMEQGFDRNNLSWGLPVAGSTFTAEGNASYSFQMAPSFSAPNGILIDGDVPGATFTLTTPAAYTLLSFVTSGGNGGHTIGVTVHHQDESTQSGSITSPDWFNASGIAWTAGGRVDTTRNFGIQDNGANPRLYFRDVVLTNTTSPVTSIDLFMISGNSGAHSDVIAVSGDATGGGTISPIAVTGYTYDFIVEKEAPQRQRVLSATMEGGTNQWATTQTMENQDNTSWTFYEQGYNIDNPDGNGYAPNPATLDTGLPLAGSNVTNALGDHIFTMSADYAVNNACYLTTGITNQSITFVTPTTASVLSFLCSAGGGAATLDVVINHQDLSTETKTIAVPDWFNTSGNLVVDASGRASADNATFSSVLSTSPRLHSVDLAVSDASPVMSIDFTHRDTGGQVGIFAVSGTTDATLPVFTEQPESQKVNVSDNVTFTAIATANVPITYQWQSGTDGVFVDVVNGGNISGATTTTLMLSSVLDQDYPDYRCVATDSAGSATSATASLLVLSALLDVTLAGDPVSPIGPPGFADNYPGGEAPPNAINDTTLKYLHFGDGDSPLTGPVGFEVFPTQGRTVISAIRHYSANDATERNPANVIFEGSNDGGVTYTLIYSNLFSMEGLPSNTSGASLDPINQSVAQVRFDNTNSYTSYRWYVTQLQGETSLMQIGEVEFLGIVDFSDPSPYFAYQPVSMTVYDQGDASFEVYALGNPTPTVQWQKGTDGVYVDLVDGGNVSGSQGEFLTISPAGFGDAADYRCVAVNTAGTTYSAVATLGVVSTGVDVTAPSDPITGFGDEAGDRYGADANPTNAVDNYNTIVYINGGSGLNTAAGFPPFVGPVGVVVTPAVGYTDLSGLRIYTANSNSTQDPTDYILEGSNDGGASYTVISQGPLDLPLARADNNFAFNPTQQPMQEILFTSASSYLSYRLTFTHTRNDESAVALRIGEFELLGVEGTAPVDPPVLSVTPDGEGGFVIDSTESGNVYSTTNLSGTNNWTLEGPTPLSVTPDVSVPEKYYQQQ